MSLLKVRASRFKFEPRMRQREIFLPKPKRSGAVRHLTLCEIC